VIVFRLALRVLNASKVMNLGRFDLA